MTDKLTSLNVVRTHGNRPQCRCFERSLRPYKLVACLRWSLGLVLVIGACTTEESSRLGSDGADSPSADVGLADSPQVTSDTSSSPATAALDETSESVDGGVDVERKPSDADVFVADATAPGDDGREWPDGVSDIGWLDSVADVEADIVIAADGSADGQKQFDGAADVCDDPCTPTQPADAAMADAVVDAAAAVDSGSTDSVEAPDGGAVACSDPCTATQPWCTDSETVGVCGNALDGCMRLFEWPCPATQVCVAGTCECTGTNGPVCKDWWGLADSKECSGNNSPIYDDCEGSGCWKDACVYPPVGDYVNIVPTGWDLDGVWVGPDGFIAVGTGSTAVHEVNSDLAGLALQDRFSGLQDVFGLPSGVAFAAFSWGLCRYDGQEWSVASMPAPPTWIAESIQAVSWSQKAVWAASETDVWFGGEAGTLYHYDGTVSTLVSHPHTGKKDVTILGIWGSGTDDVYIVGNPGVALHYDGKKLLPIPGLDTSIGGIGGFDAVDGNDQGKICALRDDAVWCLNGSVWAEMVPAPPLMTGTNDLAITSSGQIYIKHAVRYHWFDGTVWHTVEHGIKNGFLRAVDAFEERVVMAGVSGLLLEVSGDQFTLLTKPAISGPGHENMTDVWGTSDGAVFAVGEWGKVYRRIGTNLTEVWDLTAWLPLKSLDPTVAFLTAASSHTIARVWASSASDAYIGGLGVVAHFDGSEWTKLEIPGLTPATIVMTIHGTGPDDVYIGGVQKGVAGLFVHWDGMKWTPVDLTSVPDPWVGAVWCEQDGDVLALIGGLAYFLDESGPQKLPTYGMGLQLCASHIVSAPNGAVVVGHGGVGCFSSAEHIFARTQTGKWLRLSWVYTSFGLFHAAPTPKGNFLLVAGTSEKAMLLDTEALTAVSLVFPTLNELPQWAQDIVLRPVFDFAQTGYAVWVSEHGDAYLAGGDGNIIRAPLDE